MPDKVTPGVYIEEVPSGGRAITGVSTSATAFIGFFQRGPLHQAVQVTSFSEVDRIFGGLDPRSEASYGLHQFFQNGGQTAWIVRIAGGKPQSAELPLDGTSAAGPSLTVMAANPGEWGNQLQVGVDHETDRPEHFNLVVREVSSIHGQPKVVIYESYTDLTLLPGDPYDAIEVVNQTSALIRLQSIPSAQVPRATGRNLTNSANIKDTTNQPGAFIPLQGGRDGQPPTGSRPFIAGLEQLEAILPAQFNILCIPAASLARNEDSLAEILITAADTCERNLAFFIADPPAWIQDLPELATWLRNNDRIRHPNAAVYFPQVKIPDPLNNHQRRGVGASGTMAGIYARIDQARGVWKAPAGTEAVLHAATPDRSLTAGDLEMLTSQGVNGFRENPAGELLSWGARTLVGTDALSSEWKYISVRRTALYIEKSIQQGLQWVVFEPNDEPLWQQIRFHVETFMMHLFRQGALQGSTAQEAFFIRCDSSTTTQADINNGNVNLLVGFAPLKPAEFEILRFQLPALKP